MLNRLESECQRLRSHLAQSVPESEAKKIKNKTEIIQIQFMREKEQYTAIINKLVEENMHLRSVIGQFEQRRKGKKKGGGRGEHLAKSESERIIAQLGGSDALVRQFRQTAISSRQMDKNKANLFISTIQETSEFLQKSIGKSYQKKEKRKQRKRNSECWRRGRKRRRGMAER